MEYHSARDYIKTAKDLKDKIAKVEEIIEALEDSVLAAASNSHISEYDLNDGQTRIKAVYRNAKEVADSIRAFQQILEGYRNKLDGRRVRLIPARNFFR